LSRPILLFRRELPFETVHRVFSVGLRDSDNFRGVSFKSFSLTLIPASVDLWRCYDQFLVLATWTAVALSLYQPGHAKLCGVVSCTRSWKIDTCFKRTLQDKSKRNELQTKKPLFLFHSQAV
jgi:hypothetical protein